ncbi:glycosyltransferase [Tritonibacter sp. SIMBA_163]
MTGHVVDTVTVAISTLGMGVSRIQLPEPVAGIEYLILLQAPEESLAPRGTFRAERRADVRFVELPDRGLSRSRNAGLAYAHTDLVLFSDDDVTLEPEGILTLRDHFVSDPNLALAAGWRRERLPQAARKQHLTRFNSGRICAPEFMVRASVVARLGVQFDLNFGLGAYYGVGEDYVFVSDILHAGGRGVALPVVTGSHPDVSTGEKWSDPRLLRARQAVINRVFGSWALPVRFAYGMRHRRRFANFEQLFAFFWG